MWTPLVQSLQLANELGKNATEARAHYVISLPRCRSRIAYRATRALGNRIEGQNEIFIPAVDFASFSTRDPPIQVVYNEKKTEASAHVTAGQVACTASHRAAWADALNRNMSASVILEDDVELTPGTKARLASIIRDADLGAKESGRVWHWIYLRRVMLKRQSQRDWYGQISLAAPSWGTAAYILSRAGVAFMLNNIKRHEEPLDVAVGRLQEKSVSNQFVALDACLKDDDPNCPKNVVEIPLSAQGECAYSTTQSGWRVRADYFRCAWP